MSGFIRRRDISLRQKPQVEPLLDFGIIILVDLSQLFENFESAVGADFVIVGGITNVPAFYVTVSPDVKSIEDLKGRTVGVTRFGSASDFAMRYVLRKHGL